MYYIQENGKVLLADESQYKLIDTIKFMPQYQGLDILQTVFALKTKPLLPFELQEGPE